MTFFIQTPCNSAIVSHALEFASDPQFETLPQVKMPVIKIPASAKRNYNDSELSTAALMLEKLRSRKDMSPLADKAVAMTSQSDALDVAIERLLDVLK